MIKLFQRLIKVYLGRFKILFDKLINFIFPATCPICKDNVLSNNDLCPDCWNKINWISSPKCYKCGYPFPANLDREKFMLCPDCIKNKSNLDMIRSSCEYDSFSREIILAFKYSNTFRYNKLISGSMIRNLKDIDDKIDLIVPMPLSYLRLIKRGYNQATLIAKPIAKHLGVKIDINSIKRKYKESTKGKNFKERKENVKNVFKVVNKNKIEGKSILIVDDVMTSKSSLEELAKTLKKAGANKIFAVTFARTVIDI